MNLYELDERMLNVWVAKVEGHLIATIKNGSTVAGYQIYFYSGDMKSIPDYCGDSETGKAIIEKYGIEVDFIKSLYTPWQATLPKLVVSRRGPTELIATMRALVASVYGNELPDEV